MWACILGTVRPKKVKGAGLALSCCGIDSMKRLLEEISAPAGLSAQAVLILDRAG
ncbi:hypothetical protein GGR04_004620 [Aureimonas pseudogalii]|uniref:Uncharacterized protein n=1 Tax=Aureimonas pseudogalii TaxID=1744844 RepID=A0A7W6MMD7_9HYPH|nr:hypothetical protein [Aureimonas pseudogalii]